MRQLLRANRCSEQGADNQHDPNENIDIRTRDRIVDESR